MEPRGTTDQSILLQIAQHDNALALELPYQPPEVGDGGDQGPLCGNVCIAQLVTLQHKGAVKNTKKQAM